MGHAGVENFLATSRAPETSLLLGSHRWIVHNDSWKCSTEEYSYTTKLTLHTCKPDKEFACDNGFCIIMEKRCDGRENCDDGSDEQDCSKIIIKPGYKKSLTPVPVSGNNLVVNISFHIKDILEVNELKGTFNVKLSLKRAWFDNRLTYKNLKQDEYKNDLSPGESALIWFPPMLFF